MARPTNGPKGPTPEEIDLMVDLVNEWLTYYESHSDLEPKAVAASQAKSERLVEILDWAGEQVSKRRLYSKKFQLKDKARTQLLKEHFGEEYAEIVKAAAVQADKNLFEEVANAEPDPDELAELQKEEE